MDTSNRRDLGGKTDSSSGLIVGLLTGAKPGINKDSLSCQWSPHFHLHPTAVDLATQATEDFIDMIRSDLSSDELLRLLFGVPMLAICVDTTSSMSDVITAVKQQAIQAAQSLLGTEDEPGLYLISPFNDPDSGPVILASSFDDFQSTINGLTTSTVASNTDCPEKALHGILNALQIMAPGTMLTVFTDDYANDYQLQNNVTELALSKNIAIDLWRYPSNCAEPTKRGLVTRATVPDVYGAICAATGVSTTRLPGSRSVRQPVFRYTYSGR